MAVMEIIAGLAGLTAADLLAAKIFYKLHRNERRPDAIYFVTTADGWRISLSRYNPPAGAAREQPVVCCHGLSGNHEGFDLTERTSLARTLAAAGHPTFLLDLRGAGHSDKGGPLRPKPLRWRLSDHYQYDAPAAVDKVLALTGADRVHWIGHSMGGMTAYAFLQGPLAAKVSRCVILASPSTFGHLKILRYLAPLVKWLPGVPLRILSQSVAPLFEFFKPLQTIGGLVALAPGVAQVAAVNVDDQTPMSLLLDFARFIEAGRFIGDDGRDLLDGLRNVRTPMLFMVGDADQTAKSGSVRAAYEACGSPEKKYVALGPRHGQQGEYGHLTLLLGPHVQEEVYPQIIEWLSDR